MTCMIMKRKIFAIPFCAAALVLSVFSAGPTYAGPAAAQTAAARTTVAQMTVARTTAAQTAAAQQSPAGTAAAGEGWLDALARTMKGRYAASFTMQMQGAEPVEGYYAVDGDCYYMTLGVSEVYGDGKLRYEINNERKEVTEDRIDTASVDLLNNPTRAFDFVDRKFSVSVEERSPREAVIVLRPLGGDDPLTEIRIDVRRTERGVEPSGMEYDFDGDRISICLGSLVFGSGVEVRRWDAGFYRAYDMISFL